MLSRLAAASVELFVLIAVGRVRDDVATARGPRKLRAPLSALSRISAPRWSALVFFANARERGDRR